LYFQNCDDLKNLIMDELHKRPYIGHPSYPKMITTNKLFNWSGMKKDIANYLVKCLEFQLVKVEHKHVVGIFHPLRMEMGNHLHGFYHKTTQNI
jgi:hypothetical protein